MHLNPTSKLGYLSFKGRVVFGTVYGDMHLKDLLGSIVREVYCIPVPDSYLVSHGLCCRRSTIKEQSINRLMGFTARQPMWINLCLKLVYD